MNRTISELAADYDEVDDFRNQLSNEDILNSMVDVALKLNRQIVECPVNTFEELQTKAWHIFRNVAHLKLDNEPPVCLEDLGYWMLLRDIKALVEQEPQQKAAA